LSDRSFATARETRRSRKKREQAQAIL